MIRALWAIATLIFTSILVFAATQLMPGNVAQLILGQFASPEAITALEVRLGLDRPAIVQFGSWFGGIIRGDFGVSPRMGCRSARSSSSGSVIRWCWRLSLCLVALIGITLGTIAALRRGRALDRVLPALRSSASRCRSS